MSHKGQSLAPGTLVWVMGTFGKTETEKASSNVTIGFKGVFHPTTQMQLWSWVLIRDLLHLTLEMCHQSHSSSPPAPFVPSSAPKKK